ncbi:MAG: hypothetical protein ACRD2W_22840 [Acidimicrobiales bacterium]
MMWAETETAWRYTNEAVAYAEEHQVDALGTYARMMTAWLELRAGDWTEAERTAGVVAATETGVNQLLANGACSVLTSSNGGSLGVLLGRATKLPVSAVPGDGILEPPRPRDGTSQLRALGDLYVDCRGHGTPQRVGDWRVHLRPLHDLTQRVW